MNYKISNPVFPIQDCEPKLIESVTQNDTGEKMSFIHRKCISENTGRSVYNNEGRLVVVLNGKLIKEKDLSIERITEIERLHVLQAEIKALMKACKPQEKEKISALLARWRENEFQLQETWGFERNIAFHKDFELPHCICPKIDNEERWGMNSRIYREDCPVHSNPNWPKDFY